MTENERGFLVLPVAIEYIKYQNFLLCKVYLVGEKISFKEMLCLVIYLIFQYMPVERYLVVLMLLSYALTESSFLKGLFDCRITEIFPEEPTQLFDRDAL